MVDLEALRDRWSEDRPKYDNVLTLVKERLREGLSARGIGADVTGRLKETGSLLKKMVRGGSDNEYYKSMPDKAGARVVVRFRDDIDTVRNIIDETFEHSEFDDKAALLGESEVGYQSVHVNVSMPADGEELPCEIQIRTLAQHVWAEVSHSIVYKKGDGFPSELLRRLNIGSALLEVLDREFAEVRRMTQSSPLLRSLKVLAAIEPMYLTLGRAEFDRQLSSDVVTLLLPIVEDQDLEELQRFMSVHRDRLLSVIPQHIGAPNGAGLFLTQPEGLLLLYLLETKRNQLRRLWGDQYAEGWLQDLADVWGVALGFEP